MHIICVFVGSFRTSQRTQHVPIKRASW